MSIIRRRRRCLPIDSDSSEDDHFDKRRLRSSSTSSAQAISIINNRKKGGRLPIVTSEEEDEESSGQVVEFMQVNDRFDNYDVTSNSDEHGKLVFGSIWTGKRILNSVDYSEVDSSDSDSTAPIGFQMKRKRMKFCSSSSEGSLEDEHSEEAERAVRLNSSARPDNHERPNTSRNSRRNLTRTMRNRVAANQRIWNRIESDDSVTETSSDDDIRPRVLRHRSNIDLSRSVRNRVAANQRKWRRIESDDSESEATSDDDIRPRVLRRHSRTVFYSNSSSSDSEYEVQIRRSSTKRRAGRTIIYSDDDNSCQQEIPDEEPEVCPICLSDFDLQEVGKPSACDHSFCFGCIREWANNNNTCPVDRRQFVSILVLSSIRGEPVGEIPVFNVQRMIAGWEAEEVEVTFQSFYSSDDQERIDEVCCHCMMSSGNDSMIYCDACYNVYHLQCVDPPLHSYPAGPWICAQCENTTE